MRAFYKLSGALFTFVASAEAFAGGGSIVFSTANSIPTLPGMLLIVLGLFLGLIAFKMMKSNGFNNKAFTITAMGAGAVLSAASGLQVINSVEASAPVILVNTGDIDTTMSLNIGDNVYQNNTSKNFFVKNINFNGMSCNTAVSGYPNLCTVSLVIPPGSSCSLNCSGGGG